MVKQGFEEWVTKTTGNIKFDYIKDEKFADINVIFQNMSTKEQIPLYELIVGQASVYHYEVNKIRKAEIFIVDRELITKRYLPKEELYCVIRHEIGHAIGLLKHSNDIKSIMHAEYDAEQKITNDDIERLRKIYKF